MRRQVLFLVFLSSCASAQSPFSPTCAFEAEQFDEAHGAATNSLYRASPVPIQKCRDLGGGFCVGPLAKGDRLAYQLDVPEGRFYTLEARVASDGAFHFEVDGDDRTGPLSAVGSAWQTVARTTVPLKAGRRRLELVCDSSGPTFNSISIYPTLPGLILGKKTLDVTQEPYGARGDGKLETADRNREAFQEAVDDLAEAGGGVLRVPAGTYVLEQATPDERPGADAYRNAAVLVAGRKIEIRGEGEKSILKAANRSTTLFFLGDPAHGGQVHSISLRDLTLIGQPHRKPDGTPESGGVWNGDWTLGALVVFRGASPQNLLTDIRVSGCRFINPSVNALELGCVKNALIDNNEFVFFQGEAPYGRVTDEFDRATRPFPINVVAIRSGEAPVRNILVTNNRFNGNPALDERRRSLHAADGFLWLSNGGNWFVARNAIARYALEAVQLNAGPAAVVENKFSTPTDNPSSTALLCFHNDEGPNLSSGHSLLAEFSFLGNSVDGGSSGVHAERPAHLPTLTAPFNLKVSNNRFKLLALDGRDNGAAVLAANARRLSVAGNTLESGGKGVHLVDGCRDALIQGNDFSGAREHSILTQETAPSLGRVSVIGNVLSSGYGAHVWVDGKASDFQLRLQGNEFQNALRKTNEPIIRPNDSRVTVNRL